MRHFIISNFYSVDLWGHEVLTTARVCFYLPIFTFLGQHTCNFVGVLHSCFIWVDPRFLGKFLNLCLVYLKFHSGSRWFYKNNLFFKNFEVKFRVQVKEELCKIVGPEVSRNVVIITLLPKIWVASYAFSFEISKMWSAVFVPWELIEIMRSMSKIQSINNN